MWSPSGSGVKFQCGRFFSFTPQIPRYIRAWKRVWIGHYWRSTYVRCYKCSCFYKINQFAAINVRWFLYFFNHQPHEFYGRFIYQISKFNFLHIACSTLLHKNAHNFLKGTTINDLGRAQRKSRKKNFTRKKIIFKRLSPGKKFRQVLLREKKNSSTFYWVLEGKKIQSHPQKKIFLERALWGKKIKKAFPRKKNI